MIGSARAAWRSKKLGLAIALLAVLAFNNWFLAIFFNHSLFVKGGSVSEFSVTSQPHSATFRTLDVLSGIFFVLLALWLAKKAKNGGRGYQLMLIATAILGISNAMDAILPLTCSETLNINCNIPIHISPALYDVPGHAYTSVFVGLSYFLLPLGGFIYAARVKLARFQIVSLLTLAVAMLSFVTVIGNYIAKGTFSVHTWGFSQEAQMLILSFWLLSWLQSSKKPHSTPE